MSEDIVERLKKLLIPPVWDDPDDMQILKDAIAEIEFLRTHAGAVTRGDSFDDIMRKTGPQKRGEAS